jgi:hypothetical protein
LGERGRIRAKPPLSTLAKAPFLTEPSWYGGITPWEKLILKLERKPACM